MLELGTETQTYGVDRLADLMKRLSQLIESLAGVTGAVAGFNARMLGVRPEKDRAVASSQTSNGKLDEMAEMIARLAFMIGELNDQVQQLERIG